MDFLRGCHLHTELENYNKDKLDNMAYFEEMVIFMLYGDTSAHMVNISPFQKVIYSMLA